MAYLAVVQDINLLLGEILNNQLRISILSIKKLSVHAFDQFVNVSVLIYSWVVNLPPNSL